MLKAEILRKSIIIGFLFDRPEKNIFEHNCMTSFMKQFKSSTKESLKLVVFDMETRVKRVPRKLFWLEHIATEKKLN